ncbi:unnamed protein product [Leuciscus chuanchicus]
MQQIKTEMNSHLDLKLDTINQSIQKIEGSVATLGEHVTELEQRMSSNEDDDKLKILKLAKDKNELVYNGSRIYIYPDFSAALTAKRRQFDLVKKKLRDLDFKYSLIFPCTLKVIQDGKGAWYTPGRKHRPATGFLEECLRNVRKRMRKLKQPEYGVPLEKVQEMVEWLKVHKYPISEVENYMKETAIYRGKWIRNNGSKSIPEVLKEFPRLVDNPGMISQDFKQLYPDAARKLFENWTTVSDAQREGKLHSVLCDMTPAAKEETALKVLPTLLPPSIYRRGGKVFRPTTEKAQRGCGEWLI